MPDNFQQPTNGTRSSGTDNPTASETAGKLGAKAQQTTERLRNTALERVSEARDKADAQKGQLVERVRRVGSAVREAGDKLREEDQLIGRYAGVAADGIERAASYLGNADPRAAMRDIDSLARRKPALFFGGAFLLGLAAGRFLKSSQHHANEIDDEQYTPDRYRRYDEGAGEYGRYAAQPASPGRDPWKG